MGQVGLSKTRFAVQLQWIKKIQGCLLKFTPHNGECDVSTCKNIIILTKKLELDLVITLHKDQKYALTPQLSAVIAPCQQQKAANHDKTKDVFPSNLIYKCRMLSRTYRRCDPWQRLCILQCETTWSNGTLCPGTDVITLSMHWNSMERDSNHHSSSSDFFIYTSILNESEKENTLASKTVSIMCIILCCAYATYIDKTFMHTFHMCIHQLCFL